LVRRKARLIFGSFPVLRGSGRLRSSDFEFLMVLVFMVFFKSSVVRFRSFALQPGKTAQQGGAWE
jgi:hypothetical protein